MVVHQEVVAMEVTVVVGASPINRQLHPRGDRHPSSRPRLYGVSQGIRPDRFGETAGVIAQR